jgi:hypothetical protein
MSNTWHVFWAGSRADNARLILLEAGPRAVRCGAAHAVWQVIAWAELSGERVGATLIPMPAHEVNPCSPVPELPIPQGLQ